MSNRGRSQNVQNLIFFEYFRTSPLRSTLPRGIRLKLFQYEMKAIFTEKSRTRDLIQHSSLWEQ